MRPSRLSLTLVERYLSPLQRYLAICKRCGIRSPYKRCGSSRLSSCAPFFTCSHCCSSSSAFAWPAIRAVRQLLRPRTSHAPSLAAVLPSFAVILSSRLAAAVLSLAFFLRFGALPKGAPTRLPLGGVIMQLLQCRTQPFRFVLYSKRLLSPAATWYTNYYGGR